MTSEKMGRQTRARCSERAAERDVREPRRRPVQARQGAGERQAFRACGPDNRKWKP